MYRMVESPLHDVESLSVSAEELFRQSSWTAFFKKISGRVHDSATPHVLSVTLPVAPADPLAVLQKDAASTGFIFYWEKPDHNIGLCGGETLLTLTADGPDRFERLSHMVSTWQNRTFSFPDNLPEQPLFTGGFSFFDEYKDDRWSDFHNGLFAIPSWLYFRKDEKGYATINILITPASRRDQIEEQLLLRFQQFTDRFEDSSRSAVENQTSCGNMSSEESDSWKEKVDEITRRIKNGEFQKVVLARSVRIQSKEQPNPHTLLTGLKEKYPNCYQFWIRPSGNKSFFGSTPERLAAFHNGHLVTESLAGSISRNTDESRDKDLAEQLMQSEKDQMEHRYVVDSIIDRLQPFTEKLYAPGTPRILRFPNVQHLYTPITGQLKEDVNPLEIIRELHPTPAVGGLPRQEALELIRQIESFERGWYAGPVGWLDRSGNGEFSVAIRSALLEDGEAEVYAGCGVVADSDPQSEWDETELKLIPLLTAFQAV